MGRHFLRGLLVLLLPTPPPPPPPLGVWHCKPPPPPPPPLRVWHCKLSLESIPPFKRPRSGLMAPPRIGTHNGTFHCDEALACALLRLLPEYRVQSAKSDLGVARVPSWVLAWLGRPKHSSYLPRLPWKPNITLIHATSCSPLTYCNPR